MYDNTYIHAYIDGRGPSHGVDLDISLALAFNNGAPPKKKKYYYYFVADFANPSVA